MKYLVVGSGGTGGALGAYLARAGRDVTLIARGEKLKAMRERGLRIFRLEDEFTVDPIKCCAMDDYQETPDVILLCVKGYSVDSTIPFIRRVAGPSTVVIPILNIYGTGGRMQKDLPGVLITDGCIYIASELKEPGVILMSGPQMRIVFGVREKSEYRPALADISRDLKECGISADLSDDIRRDALVKFSYVSPQGACGIIYGIPIGPMQQEGPERECFKELVREVEAIGRAQGMAFQEDLVARNLRILDSLKPSMTTSMQKDIVAGRQSEAGGQIFEVARLGHELGVPVPMYEKAVAALEAKGIRP